MRDLDAIQARADAATPGPWEWFGGGGPRVRIPGARDLCRWHEFDSPTVADGQFIAYSRTDVPALVAELRAARNELYVAREFRPLVAWMARQPCVCEQPVLPVTGGPPCQYCVARVALATYDQLTEESTQ